MVLLLLGDSQVERIWPSVRLDREVLRDAIYFPVKNRSAILSGYKSITAAVRIMVNASTWIKYFFHCSYLSSVYLLFNFREDCNLLIHLLYFNSLPLLSG